MPTRQEPGRGVRRGARSGKTVPPRIHRHTLVEMNRSVFTARRGVAYTRAAAILRREISGSTKERQIELYATCVALLDDAITATQRSQLQQDSPLIHYLKLLRDAVKANCALVTHEVMLVREALEFSPLQEAGRIAEFQAVGDVFSKSEENIRNCIEGLLRFGEPLLARDTAERVATFSADDRRRYALARQEYRAVYRGPRRLTPRRSIAGCGSRSGPPASH